MKKLEFFDFRLGDRLLSDFGGVLYNANDIYRINLAPSLNVMSEQLPYMDGVVPYSATYNPRVITLDIYFDGGNFDRDVFTNWICSKEPQAFNFVGDDKVINVVYQEQLDLEIYNSNQGTITVQFIAYDPLWRELNETSYKFENFVEPANRLKNFQNYGSQESFPLIKLECTGVKTNIRFRINELTVWIKEMNIDIYIDCETETVFDYTVGKKNNKIAYYECLNGVHKYQFPKLRKGLNTFEWLQGDNGVKVTIFPRSKWI